jgi:hypothetical protein
MFKFLIVIPLVLLSQYTNGTPTQNTATTTVSDAGFTPVAVDKDGRTPLREGVVQSINQLSLQPSLGQLLVNGLAVTPVVAAEEERRHTPMSREELLIIANGLFAMVLEDDFEDNDDVGPYSPEQREETRRDRDSKTFPKQ